MLGLSVLISIWAFAVVSAVPLADGGPVNVALFGDSLAYQAAPYFDTLVEAGGRANVRDFVFGGTAVCDWLPEMRKVAQSRPQVVVMEFAGNTFTPCMGGCPAGSSSAISRYCVDMSEAIHLFLAVGTRVFLEGSPIDYTEWATHDRHWIDLNRAFSSLATRYPGRVTYVDAGGAVEGPGQSFSWTLPCLSFEPCTGPIVSGVHTNVVRSPDGVHFCPIESRHAQGRVARCDVYSSGAFRFAMAMAAPVIAAFHLSTTRRSFVIHGPDNHLTISVLHIQYCGLVTEQERQRDKTTGSFNRTTSLQDLTIVALPWSRANFSARYRTPRSIFLSMIKLPGSMTNVLKGPPEH